MLKFVLSRIDPIIEMGVLENKKVLELGCVGMGETDEYGGVNWIHGKASKIAKKIVGLDLNKKGIEKLKKLGFGVKYQNVEKPFDLKEKFDVVLVNEVLEHLNNPGVCFENIRKHLKNGGLLIITTPNAQSHVFFLQRMLLNKISGVSLHDHTHWYCAETLNTFLKRYKFEIIKMWCVHPRPVFNKLRGYLLQLLWYPLPERLGRNIICIAKKLP